MAKSYKQKHEEEVIVTDDAVVSKKEQYDLEKKKRMAIKEKKSKKNASKSKKLHKGNQSNLGARLFAIFMLVLMVGSVIVSALAYVLG